VALFDPQKDGAPLALMALPVVGDTPPIPELQPVLPNGIHLRWAFDVTQAFSFPWWGFYIFRRLSLTSGAATCAASQLGSFTPGPFPSTDLTIPLGTFHSDQNLVLTDDFPAAGTVEIDLSGRTFVSFIMNPAQPNRHVDVKIGFVADFPPPGGTPGTPGTGGSPGPAGGLGAGAAQAGICGCGCEHAALRPIVDGVVALGGGQYRATFGYDNAGASATSIPIGPENRFFPDPPDRGQPTLLAGGQQHSVFSVVFDGQPLSWRLGGNTVTVSAADAQGGGNTGGGGTGAAGIVVSALRLGVVVATRVVSGRAGQVINVPIDNEAFDEVRVSSGPARLVDLCATLNTDGRTSNWAPLPGLTQPIALPVKGPKYPISTGNPDVNGSQAVALARITYAFPLPGGPPGALDISEWAGQSFSDLHSMLSAMIANGPPGFMNSVIPIVTADPDPNDPNDFRPTWTNQSALNIVVGASANPAMAQMLGLYFVDQQVTPGTSYDYLLVGDYRNGGNGSLSAIQALVNAGNYTKIDAYERLGVIFGATPPLAPPDTATLQAYSLPLASVPVSAPGDAAGQVGLRWGIGKASDQSTKIAPTDSFLFHVWRKDFGRAGPGAGEIFDPASFTRQTAFAVAPGVPRVQDPPAVPLAGWPSGSLFDLDGPLVEGWYSYRVNGMDLFGRTSARSELMPWLDPDGTLEDARAVHVIDTTPPPPPTHVQAWLLDPQDPFVLQDAAYNAWRSPTPPVSGRATTIGLRVRWAWGAQERRQAPDAHEFRIYLNAGSQLQNPSIATSWATRIAVVGLGEQMVAQSLLPLQTPDPDPQNRQNIVGQSVSISGRQVTLVDGPPLDSVVPGEAELELVVNSVGNQFAVVDIDAQNRVVTVDQPVQNLGTVTAWALLPLRTYELFLPGTALATPPAFTPPAAPPRDTPVAYSLVGVSCADDKDRTDLRAAPQPLTPRPGNEGGIGGPALVVQILRTPPDPPPATFTQQTLMATRADFLSRSFFTLHPVKKPTAQDPAMAVHVYRALDETVFQIDAGKRFPPPPTPPTADGPGAVTRAQLGWDQNRYNTAAGAISNLTPTGYATLQPDALRLLASLPSNAGAFSCLTRKALAADTADERGLSDDPSYDPTSRNDVLGFTDLLDGRATNRYFYRTTLVDEAQNQSKLGVATPPVLLPVTAVPEAPRLATALGGDRSVALSLLAVADPAVVSYKIYRANSPQGANDVRSMQPPIATVNDTRDVSQRANPLPLPPDTNVVPYQDYFYRVTANLPGGGESPPSAVMSARPFDGTPPPEPTWERSEWVKLDDTGIEHPFTDTDPDLIPALAVRLSFASATVARAMIQLLNGDISQPLSPWLAPLKGGTAGTTTFAAHLTTLPPTVPRTLQSRAVTQGGREALSNPQTVPAP